MEVVLYRALIGAASAGFIAIIILLFKFIKNKSIGEIFYPKRKTLVIITIICSSLFLLSLVIYNVSTFGMQDAYDHYVATLNNYDNTYSVGCGNYSCHYCEGALKIEPNGKILSPNSFKYYMRQSVIRTAFKIIGVVTLIMAIVSLLLLMKCLIYKHKNKLKSDKE